MKDSDNFRTEKDALGTVQVPADRYWGAQTERARQNFQIGWEKMPIELIHAFALQKKAAAQANMDLGKLDAKLGQAIERACDDVIEGKLDGEFPLAVWQTGSGTQTNMNLNEVIANRANAIL
ncbi:MAG: lyase family protein, partial [Rhodospirillaceae bacterium]